MSGGYGGYGGGGGGGYGGGGGNPYAGGGGGGNPYAGGGGRYLRTRAHCGMYTVPVEQRLLRAGHVGCTPCQY